MRYAKQYGLELNSCFIEAADHRTLHLKDSLMSNAHICWRWRIHSFIVVCNLTLQFTVLLWYSWASINAVSAKWQFQGYIFHQYTMLLKITIQCTFNFVNQLNKEIHENWYLTNIEKNNSIMVQICYKRPEKMSEKSWITAPYPPSFKSVSALSGSLPVSASMHLYRRRCYFFQW